MWRMRLDVDFTACRYRNAIVYQFRAKGFIARKEGWDFFTARNEAFHDTINPWDQREKALKNRTLVSESTFYAWSSVRLEWPTRQYPCTRFSVRHTVLEVKHVLDRQVFVAISWVHCNLCVSRYHSKIIGWESFWHDASWRAHIYHFFWLTGPSLVPTPM